MNCWEYIYASIHIHYIFKDQETLKNHKILNIANFNVTYQIINLPNLKESYFGDGSQKETEKVKNLLGSNEM